MWYLAIFPSQALSLFRLFTYCSDVPSVKTFGGGHALRRWAAPPNHYTWQIGDVEIYKIAL